MSAPSPLFFALGIIFSATLSCAAPISLQGLVTNSPFMLPRDDEPAAPVVTENATVEFRGLVATKDGVLFGLFDRSKNFGAWVKQDDPEAEFRVSAFDETSDLVTVEYQGQRFTLPLSSAKIGAAAPSPLPVVNRGGQQGGGRVNAVPGSRGDDQRRLESVAAEVRRRRALRQAATSNANPPAAQPATNGQ